SFPTRRSSDLVWSAWSLLSFSSSGCSSERRADADDDHATQRDRGERLQERRLEETPANRRQRNELERDHHDRKDQRHAVLGDQERKRVEDAAEESAAAGDSTADERIAATGQLAGIREPLGERHAHAGADR